MAPSSERPRPPSKTAIGTPGVLCPKVSVCLNNEPSCNEIPTIAECTIMHLIKRRRVRISKPLLFTYCSF